MTDIHQYPMIKTTHGLQDSPIYYYWCFIYKTFGFPSWNIRFVEFMSQSVVCSFWSDFNLFIFFLVFLYRCSSSPKCGLIHQCTVWWNCHFWTDGKGMNMTLRGPCQVWKKSMEENIFLHYFQDFRYSGGYWNRPISHLSDVAARTL